MPAEAADRCQVIVSPLLETVLSLQAVLDPRLHVGEYLFVRRAHDLPRSMRKEIRNFSFCLGGYLPQFLFPRSASSSFGDELAELQRIGAKQAASELTRSLGGEVQRDRA